MPTEIENGRSHPGYLDLGVMIMFPGYMDCQHKSFGNVLTLLLCAWMVQLLVRFLGDYLYPYCTFVSERAATFPIDGQDMIFCIATLTSMYGLCQHVHTCDRTVPVDKKAIGLNLIKNACYFNLRSDPEHKTLYEFYGAGSTTS